MFSPHGKTTIAILRASRNTSVIAYSPDGRTLATASPNGIIETWDVANMNRTANIFTYSSINSMAFDRNGDVVALGCDDGTVQLWNLPAQQKISSLPDHRVHAAVESVAYSPNGKLSASGSDDHTVRLWNTADNSLVAVLRGHTKGVRSIAFNPDGTTLASGSSDGTIRLWKTPRRPREPRPARRTSPQRGAADT
ncbi:MAG TPA: hypothetical protein VJX10_20805 [Pseudonocardiaceae bacterium]|nr:hypothetical protein [Pseudonocardiaceae bacterium]